METENNKGKTVLVLGGGIGGVRVARELNKLIGNENGITLGKILIFEKEKTNLFAPSLTKMMVGERETAQIQDDLSKVALGGIEVVSGEIESVDPNTITVKSGGQTYTGDYMVVSLGTEQHDANNLSSFGHNFYTADGAASFYKQLKNFKGGKLAVVVSSLPHKSPVAPYEAAMLVDQYLRDRNLRDKTELSLYSPEKAPMPFAGDAVSGDVRSIMQKRGISYFPQHQLTGASDGQLTFTNEKGEAVEVKTDLLAYTPDHRCPAVISKSGMCGESGWVEVNPETLETSFAKVYAIGDITSIKTGDEEHLPKAGVFAQYQALTVAHNIVRQMHGKQPDKIFTAEGKYIMDQGNGKATRVGGNFYSSSLDIKESSAINHWVKILQEKSWFAGHF
ncbi:MAG: NAD(P)/FAD-dependent oxidoreductase [Balneolia bacterium]|nr:NAD(P)/FAD-dependent oxidoreductase [Balneolia bacterium]